MSNFVSRYHFSFAIYEGCIHVEKFICQQVDQTAAILSELAKVITQEKQLLEEFYDLLNNISVVEVYYTGHYCLYSLLVMLVTIRHKILLTYLWLILYITMYVDSFKKAV